MNLHIDGDVGIGDLVFASTYWSIPTRQQNEYSQYMQNFTAGGPSMHGPTGLLSRNPGGLHLPG